MRELGEGEAVWIFRNPGIYLSIFIYMGTGKWHMVTLNSVMSPISLSPRLFRFACFVGIAAAAPMVQGGILSSYNVIVQGDLRAGSNIYGSAIVGGDVSGNQMSVGQDLEITAQEVSFTVGGTVSSGLHMQKGSLELRQASNLTGHVNWNGGGSVHVNPAIDINSVWDEVLSISSGLSTLPTTGSLDFYNPHVLNQKLFDAGTEAFSVINITTADLSGIGTAFLDMNAADTLVINVAGRDVSWPGTNLGDGGFDNWRDHASRVIWNFHEAETLSFDRSIYGSILAPHAQMTFGSDIYGTVVAKGLEMGAQIHLPSFDGEFPPIFTPIPEPSGLLGLVTVGSLASLFLRRRRG